MYIKITFTFHLSVDVGRVLFERKTIQVIHIRLHRNLNGQNTQIYQGSQLKE
jgi:hypothetical protein